MRQVEFLDAEIAEVERLIARQMLSCSDARRLMSVPGVNVICAASFLAAIGDIRRFKTSRQLAAYLGLDPKVRQSGSEPARSRRISKQGSASARWAIVEAAFSVVRQPGPLHAFYERLRARRGHQMRSSPQRPSSRACSGAYSRANSNTPTSSIADRQEAPPPRAHRRREALRHERRRGVVDQPDDARRRTRARAGGRGLLRADGSRLASNCATKGSGRERDTGARISGPRRATSRGKPQAPDVCSLTRHRLAPTRQPTTQQGRPPTRRQLPLATPRTPRQPEFGPTARHPAETEPTGADLPPSEQHPRPNRRAKTTQKFAQGPLTFIRRSERSSVMVRERRLLGLGKPKLDVRGDRGTGRLG